MALCGACSTSEKEVPNDDNGYCGKCGEDLWIEWEDFFVVPGTSRGMLNKDFWLLAMRTAGSSSIADLMAKVFDSESERYSMQDGIEWIFEKKMSPAVLELMK